MATTPSVPLEPLFDFCYEGKWIAVNHVLLEHRYEVLAQEDSTCLAHIQWYGPWRCFVLMPKDGSIWKSRYLSDVVLFMEHLMLERRQRARAGRGGGLKK